MRSFKGPARGVHLGFYSVSASPSDTSGRFKLGHFGLSSLSCLDGQGTLVELNIASTADTYMSKTTLIKVVRPVEMG